MYISLFLFFVFCWGVIMLCSLQYWPTHALAYIRGRNHCYYSLPVVDTFTLRFIYSPRDDPWNERARSSTTWFRGSVPRLPQHSPRPAFEGPLVQSGGNRAGPRRACAGVPVQADRYKMGGIPKNREDLTTCLHVLCGGAGSVPRASYSAAN